VCNQCHTLVHAEELEQLSARAQQHEDLDQIAEARQAWAKALPLLPPDSSQAEWVQHRVRSLEIAEKAAASTPPKNQWIKKLGPLAPLAVLLSKAKVLLTVFKLNFLFSLLAFLGFYWMIFGMRFGIGFAVLILVHEMGHYVEIKRRGLPVEMPVF
jgi:hypothetical protein